MSIASKYGEALDRAMDGDDYGDLFRALILILGAMLFLFACACAVIALIAWNWKLGVPIAAFISYKLVRWAYNPKKEVTE